MDKATRKIANAAKRYIKANERLVVARQLVSEDRNKIAGRVYEAKKDILVAIEEWELPSIWDVYEDAYCGE